jgi:retinol dehydrogenase-12
MAKYSLIQSTRTQFVKLPPVHHVDLTGQTVVVTGSNVGLGLETARHFARMNPANLILAVRNKQKGDNAVISKPKRHSCGDQIAYPAL